jgi:hypothetical protein
MIFLDLPNVKSSGDKASTSFRLFWIEKIVTNPGSKKIETTEIKFLRSRLQEEIRNNEQ